MTKYRVFDEAGKVVAYEWIEDGRWWHKTHDAYCVWSSPAPGTYPHPGVRKQFTGLLDKNGVEIYEGDRLKHSVGVWVVDYESCSFYARLVSGGSSDKDLDNSYMSWEVIPAPLGEKEE